VIDLRKLTLLVVATRGHALTEHVIKDCLRQARFGEVLVYTDDATRFNIPGASFITVPDWNNKRDAGRFYYSEAACNLRTPYGLFMEWDAGIFNPGKWTEEFLAYDYIGAPWNTREATKVGNGGFTIMSERFAKYLCTDHARKHSPVYTDMDVCRTQYPAFTQAGFTYAPFDVAHDFSWELVKPKSPNTFGYHGIFNWPEMLGRVETVRRARMMIEDPYLITKMMPLLRSPDAPWLQDDLGAEAMEKFVVARAPYMRTMQPRQFGFGSGVQRPQAILTLQQRRAMIAALSQGQGLKA
jgi:hypothetical protein